MRSESDYESEIVVSHMVDESTSPVKKLPSTSSKLSLKSSIQETPHCFQEHTYNVPTYCDVCKGLLVGLWSQGYKCKTCGMNTHRGQGVGDHHNCRAEALLKPCKGHPERDLKQKQEAVKLGDAIKQIRELAKNNPNFIKEVSAQFDKDVKSKASRVMLAMAVDDERTKNLKSLKLIVVTLVRKMDNVRFHGEFYVMMVLCSMQALLTIMQTIVSFGLFIISLTPRHGFLTKRSFQLAAMHDATVTASLHTILSMVSGVFYYVACMFKQKNLIIDQFLREALKIEAETDFGISVTDAATRCKYLSIRIFITSVISMLLSFYFWHFAQPPMWEAATMHPSAHIIIPTFIFICCSGLVAYLSLINVQTKHVEKNCEDNDMIKDKEMKEE